MTRSQGKCSPIRPADATRPGLAPPTAWRRIRNAPVPSPNGPTRAATRGQRTLITDFYWSAKYALAEVDRSASLEIAAATFCSIIVASIGWASVVAIGRFCHTPLPSGVAYVVAMILIMIYANSLESGLFRLFRYPFGVRSGPAGKLVTLLGKTDAQGYPDPFTRVAMITRPVGFALLALSLFFIEETIGRDKTSGIHHPAFNLCLFVTFPRSPFEIKVSVGRAVLEGRKRPSAARYSTGIQPANWRRTQARNISETYHFEMH